MKTLNKLAITLIVASGACVALGALRPQESPEFDGQQATPFGLQASNGATLNLEDFHGRPVIIEFSRHGVRRAATNSHNSRICTTSMLTKD